MGADFRLKNEGDYRQWYGKEYTDKALHQAAVYSIPELHRTSQASTTARSLVRTRSKIPVSWG